MGVQPRTAWTALRPGRRSCRWVNARLTRLYDRDPAAAFSGTDIDLLTAHLARCPTCLQAVLEIRELAASLARLARRRSAGPRTAAAVLVRALLTAEPEKS